VGVFCQKLVIPEGTCDFLTINPVPAGIIALFDREFELSALNQFPLEK
jgi:hypothetical protein